MFFEYDLNLVDPNLVNYLGVIRFCFSELLDTNAYDYFPSESSLV